MSGDTEKIRILKDGCRSAGCDGTRLNKPHDLVKVELAPQASGKVFAGECPECHLRIVSFKKKSD